MNIDVTGKSESCYICFQCFGVWSIVMHPERVFGRNAKGFLKKIAQLLELGLSYII